MVGRFPGKFSTFVPLDAPKIHSLALYVLRFLRKTFSKLLQFALQNTPLWMIFNKYIQMKNLWL